MLELSQVSKCYGDNHALKSVDLAVMAGETVVLIGPSGCGKSTLLRLIVGLLQPDSGTVTFEGQVLTASISARGAPTHGLCHPGGRVVPASHGPRECHRDGRASAA